MSNISKDLLNNDSGNIKNDQGDNILSPCDGKLLPIENFPNNLVANKYLGEGVCIIPSNDVLLAPIEGFITFFKGKQGFILKGNNTSLWVHVGINSLFNENIFSCYKEGEVKSKDKVLKVDVKGLRSSNIPYIVGIVILHSKKVKYSKESQVQAGKTLILSHIF